MLRKKPSSRFAAAAKVEKSLVTHRPAVWSIQAETEEAAQFFLNTHHVGLGWTKIGNLRNLEANREAFKSKILACYLDVLPRLVPIYASILFQFAYRIALSDLVVYPSRRYQRLYIGRIAGAYKFDPNLSETYPNLYPVTWLAAPLYSMFSRRALAEIYFPLAVSRIRNNIQEIFAAIANETDAHQPTKARKY